MLTEHIITVAVVVVVVVVVVVAVVMAASNGIIFGIETAHIGICACERLSAELQDVQNRRNSKTHV